MSVIGRCLLKKTRVSAKSQGYTCTLPVQGMELKPMFPGNRSCLAPIIPMGKKDSAKGANHISLRQRPIGVN
jgi:hypothetical protein